MLSNAKISRSNITHPIFRWAGSKRRIIPRLLGLVPENYGRYYEPFFGSGCLFFALSPNKATLGDINIELISAYRALRKSTQEIFELLEQYPRTKAFYYKLRDSSSDSNQIEQAARFIYLNRFCFNGLYRTNLAGRFNVPRGKKTGGLPSLSEFIEAAKKLKGKKIICGDFEKTLKGVTSGDFVYLDPPYASNTCKDRNEYGVGSFKPTDIDRLMETLRTIHNQGAKFLLSYSTAPDFIQKLPKRSVKTIEVRRSIASNPIFRSSVPEVLLTNDDLFKHD
jgi:DNA adenine methylase (dam)